MRRLLVVSVVVLAAPVAMAQESLTKREIVNRSAGICRDLNDDVAPYVRRAKNADGVRAFIRAGRRFVRTSRPYVRDLVDLTPSDGALRYRRYANNTARALDLLAGAIKALDADRGRLAKRRAAASGDHAARARHAGERYGLRRSCIRYLR